MKRAVIITENQYPCEDAGAIRQHATAKILMEIGYSVTVLGYGRSTNGETARYDGVEYISFRPSSKNLGVRIAYRAVASARMFAYLNRHIKNANLILVADAAQGSFKRAERYAKKNKAFLIHDSVEWFSPEEFAKGARSRAYKARDNINRNLVGKEWRVMAISSYLEEHFAKQCKKTCRVPVIMDVDSIEYRLHVHGDCDKIKFAYVGSPWGKDYLGVIVEGFARLKKEQLANVELNVVGVTTEQLMGTCGVSEETMRALEGVIVAHGRLPHDEAVRFVKDADYSLLVRDENKRYAKAGFPTKIVESLSSGTPPICNLSSDLNMYLKDGENAVIVGGHTPDDVRRALERALAIGVSDRERMRACARTCALDNFNYFNYASELKKLIEK